MNALSLAQALPALLSTSDPALPSLLWTRVALHGGWALVLAWGLMRLTARLPARWRWALVGGVALWTLLPGPISAAYWLGLALQAPSLTTLLLCGHSLWQGMLRPERGDAPAARAAGVAPSDLLALWSLGGVALGWLLLLDTLALLPGSLHAWGFSVIATFLVAISLVLTRANGRFSHEHLLNWPCLLPWLALAAFVLTRLPSGNLWDALIDPLLWLTLQLHWLVKGWRWVSRSIRR